MPDRRPAEELSIQELEALLARKKREARQERLSQFQKSGRALNIRGTPQPALDIKSLIKEPRPAAGSANSQVETAKPSFSKRFMNRALLFVEIGAVVGLGFVFLSGFEALQSLNEEVAQALGGTTPSPTPLISAVVLPSGHTPPTSPGGAQPNEAEIPENLRPVVQSLASIPLPTPGPEQARSVFIPALWNGAAPVVQGDGWEQLKKGVGQHIGSGLPGQDGNLVLSAHNDIFGELFRNLDRLKPGDEIRISTASQEFLYRVTRTRVVEPTEVSVMDPTQHATITLISCYPYLVDNERIIVFGELVEG